jgi:hypothetical protein
MNLIDANNRHSDGDDKMIAGSHNSNPKECRIRKCDLNDLLVKLACALNQ